MTKYELAYQLRERAVCRGDISQSYAKTLSANAVIRAWTTCSGCGLPYVTVEQIAAATEQACCAEAWIELIQEFKHANDMA